MSTNLICMFGYGTWLYSFGVFFKPMSAEFGWTRAMTAGAYSLRSIEGGIASPLVGWAVDKYGSRVVILIGAIISGGAFALMALVNSLIGFYIVYGVLLSIGMSAMLYLPAWTVIAKWFNRKLSFALAILAVGAGFGGLICAPISAVLIENFGWRSAFIMLGILIWCVAIPLSFVVRDSPEEMGLLPDGVSPDEISDSPKASGGKKDSNEEFETGQADITLKQALKSSTFWTLSLAFFFFSMAHSTVTVHTVPALTDVGIPMKSAAFSIGLLTLVSVIGRLFFGYLGDYVNKKLLFIFLYIMMAVGLLVLMNAKTMPMVYLFIFLFGVGFGGTVPLMPAIRAEYFGTAALGKIQGFMNPVMMLAGAIGPIFAGLVYDTTGSYYNAFLVTGLLTFLAAVAMFLVKPVSTNA